MQSMNLCRKSISKEDKEKENVRNKSMPKRSLSRPNTATPKHPISDFKVGYFNNLYFPFSHSVFNKYDTNDFYPLKMKDSEAVQGAKKKYDGPPSTASSRASRGKGYYFIVHANLSHFLLY